MLFLIECIVSTWLFGTVLFGFYARTSLARAVMPGFITSYYRYLPWHAGLFALLALPPVDHYGERVALLAISALSFWFVLFHSFDADDPSFVPRGVRLWASLRPGVVAKDEAGLVDFDHLEKRLTRLNPVNALRAQTEIYKTKLDTNKLAVAKEYLDAQTDLARAARDFNEAKLRAEEAKRRSDKLD